MEQKPKLDLVVNKPTKVRLLFEKCIEGSSSYGKYFLYNILNGDGSTEYSLFAPEPLHAELKKYKKDDELIITKLAAQRGQKLVVTWDVQKANNSVEIPDLTQAEEFYYSAMEKSFEEALKIQTKFNGMANVNQIAITLFIQRTKGNHARAI